MLTNLAIVTQNLRSELRGVPKWARKFRSYSMYGPLELMLADQLYLDCHIIFPVRNRPCELIPNEGIFVIGQIFAFGMTQEVLMKSRPQNVQKS